MVLSWRFPIYRKIVFTKSCTGVELGHAVLPAGCEQTACPCGGGILYLIRAFVCSGRTFLVRFTYLSQFQSSQECFFVFFFFTLSRMKKKKQFHKIIFVEKKISNFRGNSFFFVLNYIKMQQEFFLSHKKQNKKKVYT